MANDFTICLGTIGGGVWHSPDGGESWRKVGWPFPSPGENQVRSLACDPSNPHRILAGSDVGIYLSEDNGETWEKLDSPMDGFRMWSVAFHPGDPNTLFGGISPPGVFRTRDKGKTWEKMAIDIAPELGGFAPKATAIVVDPRDHNTIWAGFEWGGVYKSLDGGDSWLQMPDPGWEPIHTDIHDIKIAIGQQTRIYAPGPTGVFSSTDEGESWDYHEFPKFHEGDRFSYCRAAAIKPDDPNTVFVGNGDSIPGDTGTVQRSRDGGRTWEALTLPVRPNSNIYWIATHPSNPNRVVANSTNGYVYISEDAGDSWQKLDKEFGEIRALLWTPN